MAVLAVLTPSVALAASDPDSTSVNQFFYSMTSGDYALTAINEFFEHVPLAGIVDLGIEGLQEGMVRMLERETTHFWRRTVRQELGQMGLGDSLSLTGHVRGAGRPASYHRSDLKSGMRWRAHASARRLGLSFLYRF